MSLVFSSLHGSRFVSALACHKRIAMTSILFVSHTLTCTHKRHSKCKEENDGQKQFISNKTKSEKTRRQKSDPSAREKERKNKQFLRQTENLKVSTHFLFDFVLPLTSRAHRHHQSTNIVRRKGMEKEIWIYWCLFVCTPVYLYLYLFVRVRVLCVFCIKVCMEWMVFSFFRFLLLHLLLFPCFVFSSTRRLIDGLFEDKCFGCQWSEKMRVCKNTLAHTQRYTNIQTAWHGICPNKSTENGILWVFRIRRNLYTHLRRSSRENGVYFVKLTLKLMLHFNVMGSRIHSAAALFLAFAHISIPNHLPFSI